VDRPIFYSVAVIIAGYIPIYALSGPSGKLFHPMADTMSIALVGALILTLTFVPCHVLLLVQEGVREPRNKPFEWMRMNMPVGARLVPRSSEADHVVATLIFAALSCWSLSSAANSCRTSTKARCGSAPPCPTRFLRGSQQESSRPQIRNILMKYPMVTDVGSELGRPTTAPTPPASSTTNFTWG
jgi:heavy metal efflux system protein